MNPRHLVLAFSLVMPMLPGCPAAHSVPYTAAPTAKHEPLRIISNNSPPPVTGQKVAGMKAFENSFSTFLQRWSVPGASIAIAKKGRLVYSRGFGWADMDANQPVKPNSLFRIASISKSVTAIAAMRLVEEGNLSLNDKPFSILSDLKPCGEIKDKRIFDVTVNDLLYCTAGWSDKDMGDPMFMPGLAEAAKVCGAKSPPDVQTIIRYWMTKPLHFARGQSWGYSNFEYALLGEVIARRSGMSLSPRRLDGLPRRPHLSN